jgi:plastocyanin domain-containing protein
MNTKWITISIIVASLLIGGAIIFSNGSSSKSPSSSGAGNVSIVDGKQIIEINVRGGYQPRKSVAKAGVPTVLRFNTNGTFDCSSSVRIPSLNVSQILPQTGSTDIDLGTQSIGKLNGSCGMGMYRFDIEFQ